MSNPFEAWAAASRVSQPMHDRAISLGYNVSANISGELGHEPDHVSFWVRRFDQPSGAERTFDSIDEVRQYLDHLETLPVYCLELVGNSRVTAEVEIYRPDAAAVVIADTETGEKFGVRFNDLEAITRLCVHAESQPTIGNWEPSN
jgi:hypothetical protein